MPKRMLTEVLAELRIPWFLSVLAMGFLLLAGSAHADTVTVVVNNASIGGGPIQTWTLNLTTGTSTFVNSFVPDGASDSNNGRGLAATNTEIYYTELTSGFGPSDGVHAVAFNGGAGGHDQMVFPNPLPNNGIQDLAFGTGASNSGDIFALAGYPNLAPKVFELDPATGNVLATLSITGDPNTTSDGFAILPNGNFLINEGDFTNSYDQYDPTTGAIIPKTNIKAPGCSSATGVDQFGGNLFFACNFNSIVETDLNGNLIHTFSLPNTVNTIEDINIVQNFNPPPPSPSNTTPEPSTMVLFGTGLLCLAKGIRKRLTK